MKIPPFIALVLGSIFVGFGAGVHSSAVVTSFETGVGSTFQEIGLLIARGVMLRKLLADSGGADQVIDKLLSKAHGKAVPWAMGLVALIGVDGRGASGPVGHGDREDGRRQRIHAGGPPVVLPAGV